MRHLITAALLFAAPLLAREDTDVRAPEFRLVQPGQPQQPDTATITPEALRSQKLASLRKAVEDAKSNLEGARGAEAPPDRIALLESILKNAQGSLSRYETPVPKKSTAAPVNEPKPEPKQIDDSEYCAYLYTHGWIDWDCYAQVADAVYEKLLDGEEKERADNKRNHIIKTRSSRRAAYGRLNMDVPREATFPTPQTPKQADINKLVNLRGTLQSNISRLRSSQAAFEEGFTSAAKKYLPPNTPTPDEWALIMKLRADKLQTQPQTEPASEPESNPDLSTPFGN